MERQTLTSTFSGVLEPQLSVLSPPTNSYSSISISLHKLHEVYTYTQLRLSQTPA
jgi:hypothetical protein